MIIKLNTQCVNTETNPPKISLNGLVLTVGEVDIDLSQIPINGEATASENSPLVGKCTRDEVTVKYPYSTHNYDPMQSTKIEDYIVEIRNGQTLECPLKRRV